MLPHRREVPAGWVPGGVPVWSPVTAPVSSHRPAVYAGQVEQTLKVPLVWEYFMSQCVRLSHKICVRLQDISVRLPHGAVNVW